MRILYLLIITIVFYSCGDYYKNDFQDNTPTSGQLKIIYDEGLHLHVKNQVATYLSQYPRAEIYTSSLSESEAVQALFNDSCRAIIISRPLSEGEKKSFASKSANPRFSIIAYSGVALICNRNSGIHKLTLNDLENMLLKPDYAVKDSGGKEHQIHVVLDGASSSVVNYLSDSILHKNAFSSNCSSVGSTMELLDLVSKREDYIGIFDFAWLSDVDDSLYKFYAPHVNFVALSRGNGVYSMPCQSSFKTRDYPLTRPVYFYRNTGDFSLAKGLEAFMAGPKGQMIFLKQGLLPSKQQERNIQVVMEPLNVN